MFGSQHSCLEFRLRDRVSDTHAPRSVSLCECACIRVISCAVWNAACVFIGCVLSCCHVLCEHVAYEFSH